MRAPSYGSRPPVFLTKQAMPVPWYRPLTRRPCNGLNPVVFEFGEAAPKRARIIAAIENRGCRTGTGDTDLVGYLLGAKQIFKAQLHRIDAEILRHQV